MEVPVPAASSVSVAYLQGLLDYLERQGFASTELLAKGLNDSAIHEDVMIGAPDTNVIGTTKDGKEVTIFTNGEWAF